jgi:hypothetical protein
MCGGAKHGELIHGQGYIRTVQDQRPQCFPRNAPTGQNYHPNQPSPHIAHPSFKHLAPLKKSSGSSSSSSRIETYIAGREPPRAVTAEVKVNKKLVSKTFKNLIFLLNF